MPPIFDLVVVAAGDQSRNERPAWPMAIIELQDFLVFLFSPLLLGQARAQDVKPALAALLVNAIWESHADFLPVLGTVELHLLGEG